MLTIKNLTLAYGPQKLIEQANLQLYKNQIVGLVGQNGSGKTTLFKLILGQLQAEAGGYDLPSNTLISHIEQEITQLTQPLLEYVLLAHPLYQNQHNDLPEYYQLPPTAEKLLINLGFQPDELMQPLTQFSGGWQMRANLAKALFCPSDLLLLDEPTNHLDIETVMWLEEWLRHYRGLAIIISHDREFLDKVTAYTIHIANHKLTLYNGNYSTFERTRAEHLEQQHRSNAKVQTKLDHLQSFVNRFKAKASKAKQAQSRLKMIEKLKFSPTFTSASNYSIEFYPPLYAPNLLLTINDAQIGYTHKSLIDKVNLQIFAGDRIALLGRNGVGKSSLIKAILAGSSLIQGKIDMHAKIRIGYFAQHTIESLSDNDTPFNLVRGTDSTLKEQEIYNYLGRFGFSASTWNQPIAQFSGGEKARLILATIILARPNILFLDEPTNHLDMQLREELAASLSDYTGAVILVSHDKFLLQSVTDQFFLIEKQRLQEFTGTLDDYQNYLLSQDVVSTKSQPKAPVLTPPFKSANKLKHEIQHCEKQLEKINHQFNETTHLLELANQQGDVDSLVTLNNHLEQLTSTRNQTEELWLNLHEQLEEIPL